MSFSDLGDLNKQRLGATFFNIIDQKSAMSKDKIDWDSATTDITLNAREISALSFQTSITRMKKDWSKLSDNDKHRLGACFFHLNADYRKSIMGKGINRAKASADFKPKSEGKPISAASFRTSITRLLINYTPGTGVNMGTPARKRKAATASASPAVASTTASPAPDISARKRTKTARAASAAAAESSNTEGSEDASEENHNKDDDQTANETQDNVNDQVEEPSDEYPATKTEPQSEWLGTDDIFGGDSTSDYLQSFEPLS